MNRVIVYKLACLMILLLLSGCETVPVESDEGV